MNAIQTLLTDHLDIWTTALLTKSTAGRGSNGKLEAYGIKKLRELILELAVRGKLLPQDPNDEPASELLEKIAAEKTRLVKQGVIRKENSLPAIADEEKSYQIPKSWEWVRLTDVYYSISPSGKKLKTSEIVGEGKHPVVDQGQSYIAGYTNDSELLIVIPGPVVIFGDHTTEIKYIDFDFVAGADGTKILRPYLMDERFFYTYLKSYKLENRGYARHFKVLNDNLYGLPPLAEQHRIVAKVDELMALCDQLEQQQTHSIEAHQTLVETLLGTLTRVETQQEFSAAWARIAGHFDTLFTTEASIDKLKQTILQLAVMGKLVPQDPNDESASVLLEKIAEEKKRMTEDGLIKKQNPLSPIEAGEKPLPLPDGWECVRFGTVAVIERGGSPRPINAYLTNDPDGLNWIKIGDTDQGGKYITSTSEKIRREGLSKTRMVYPGDFLLTNSMSFGRPYITKIEGCIHDGWLRISPPKTVDKDYLYLLLSSPYIREAFKVAAAGAVVLNLNADKVRELVIPIPPINEQHRIVAKVDELMALCDTLKARLADAQAIQLHLADAIVEQAVC